MFVTREQIKGRQKPDTGELKAEGETNEQAGTQETNEQGADRGTKTHKQTPRQGAGRSGSKNAGRRQREGQSQKCLPR